MSLIRLLVVTLVVELIPHQAAPVLLSRAFRPGRAGVAPATGLSVTGDNPGTIPFGQPV
ncbi:TPA: hypothetical protein ACM39I_004375 [Escherichia coli]|uniref:hypothetical protein n=1 Tax=Escherichia coli TaxID=562 RepID=UPI001D0CD63D|nr:hypothetical protein [Escherichia coli]